MSRAALSLGSNLGDRDAHLRRAVDRLAPTLVAVSPVYETAPWGGVSQDDFLNLVAVVDDPAATARDWLERARACEADADRDRGPAAVRWGPRTLDVDVLTVRTTDGEVRRDDPELTLPHPRLAQRAFVLVPWADVEPGAEVAGSTVAALLAALPDTERHSVRCRPGRPGSGPPAAERP